MSQYITFHLKTRDGDFLPLACFCRSNVYYEFACDRVPAYKEEEPLTRETLNYIKEDIKEAKEKEVAYLAACKERLQLVSDMNNTLEEKMEYIYNIQESIKDTNERIEELNNCDMFYCTLGYILAEAEDSKYYPDKSLQLDPDDYIYAGVECSLPGHSDEE